MRKFMLSTAGSLLLFTGALHAQTAGAAPAQAADAAHAPDIVGNWQGTLYANKDLRTHREGIEGRRQIYAVAYASTRARGRSTSSIRRKARSSPLRSSPSNWVYTGVLSPDGKSIIGKSAQGSGSLELDPCR